MTIVGGAVAPVIMGYIADTTGSMAIAFLIPLVYYGVIGGYALLNRSGSSLAKKYFFRKSPRPSLPLKRAPPLISVFSPQGRRGKPLLLVARNRYALRLADHQRSRHILRDGTALLKVDRIIEVLVL